MDEESLRLNMNATPQFIGAVTEMVWEQIGISLPIRIIVPHSMLQLLTNPANVATDLESFSRHAGRTTVTTDDVLLITRRNDALHDIIKDFIDKEKSKKGKGNSKGRAKM